ncbi:hypothetical protein ACHAWO_009959 [Cyclotella atomus]|uniref:Carboxyvinyl-carboxyphosphonate phosphorylmutase n=1 Tax=Cyclotella atomus TaxID=382360 RepID=A0ABD3QHD6_9STRA
MNITSILKLIVLTCSLHPSTPFGCPPPERLRRLLKSVQDGEAPILLLPCCYDGLTARLVALSGFDATFMTGFGVSGVNGYPDTQLVSFDEMVKAANTVAEGLSSAALEKARYGEDRATTEPVAIPCIADGDTGYGNAVNCKRTVFGYARAGMAGIMIEDQVAPKRCGHVAGKSVVPFDDAVKRVQAACDARDEFEALFGKGTGPLILARTDSLVTDGFDQLCFTSLEDAIQRCIAFRNAGCDMTFLEAPQSVEQMEEYCKRVSGPKLANMLEYGNTPILPPAELQKMGYTMAAYPLTLLSASIKAMKESLELIKEGQPTLDKILSFAETKDVVGFTKYAKEEARYATDQND